ncbi:FAD assembly factor SdhE [Thiothrix lacustris]|uniref:FAD assembly factor SdhE n=1 Tax=Thiothrix lacustris TaxID=525917 RepID=UPI0027E47DC4|nr:succinate dehydrogenase assembly factor 2 [Thiothrix lacustris]WMP19309.1 succinate dehydrogenase assembly factor 2 [Thiothrix lacustris]
MRSRRGLKELDVVFQHYLEHHYPNASPSDIQRLDELLDMQDPILLGMLLDMDPVPERYTQLIAILRQSHHD